MLGTWTRPRTHVHCAHITRYDTFTFLSSFFSCEFMYNDNNLTMRFAFVPATHNIERTGACTNIERTMCNDVYTTQTGSSAAKLFRCKYCAHQITASKHAVSTHWFNDGDLHASLCRWECVQPMAMRKSNSTRQADETKASKSSESKFTGILSPKTECMQLKCVHPKCWCLIKFVCIQTE